MKTITITLTAEEVEMLVDLLDDCEDSNEIEGRADEAKDCALLKDKLTTAYLA